MNAAAWICVPPARPAGASGQHHQQRAQALAAAGDDVLGHLVDQRHELLRPAADGVVDRRKVGPHQRTDGLQSGRRSRLGLAFAAMPAATGLSTLFNSLFLQRKSV